MQIAKSSFEYGGRRLGLVVVVIVVEQEGRWGCHFFLMRVMDGWMDG